MNFDINLDDKVNSVDGALYSKMFTSGLKYVDTDKSIAAEDVINAGETKHMKLFFEYKDTATELLENNITLTSSDPITITYEQKD